MGDRCPGTNSRVPLKHRDTRQREGVATSFRIIAARSPRRSTQAGGYPIHPSTHKPHTNQIGVTSMPVVRGAYTSIYTQGSIRPSLCVVCKHRASIERAYLRPINGVRLMRRILFTFSSLLFECVKNSKKKPVCSAWRVTFSPDTKRLFITHPRGFVSFI